MCSCGLIWIPTDSLKKTIYEAVDFLWSYVNLHFFSLYQLSIQTCDFPFSALPNVLPLICKYWMYLKMTYFPSGLATFDFEGSPLGKYVIFGYFRCLCNTLPYSTFTLTTHIPSHTTLSNPLQIVYVDNGLTLCLHTCPIDCCCHRGLGQSKPDDSRTCIHCGCERCHQSPQSGIVT